MLIIKLEADGNTSAFGADGADVSLIAKMSGSFLKQSEQTSQTHTHSRALIHTQVFKKGRLFRIHKHVWKCVSKTEKFVKKKKQIQIFRVSIIITKMFKDTIFHQEFLSKLITIIQTNVTKIFTAHETRKIERITIGSRWLCCPIKVSPDEGFGDRQDGSDEPGWMKDNKWFQILPEPARNTTCSLYVSIFFPLFSLTGNEWFMCHLCRNDRHTVCQSSGSISLANPSLAFFCGVWRHSGRLSCSPLPPLTPGCWSHSWGDTHTDRNHTHDPLR